MKHGFIPNFTASQWVYVLFVIFANYQVLRWIFSGIKFFATSELMSIAMYKLTPNSVLQKREVKRKLKIHKERQQKEKDHQEALVFHRKYKAPFFNLQFIAEDRATLFKDHKIKWQEGNQSVGQSKKPWVIENHEIAQLMFMEMSAYRDQFIAHGIWSPKMEIFWRKILPKQLVFTKKDYFQEQLKQAEADFDADKPVKASA